MLVFQYPDDPIWNDETDAVEFAIIVGEYEGRVLISRREMRSIVGHTPTPDEALALVNLQRQHFEKAAEMRVYDRKLDADANIRLTGRDLSRAGAGQD